MITLVACVFPSFSVQEEKCVRASQILENERRRENERREKMIDEQRTLAECTLKLNEERKAQVGARAQQSLRIFPLEKYTSYEVAFKRASSASYQ